MKLNKKLLVICGIIVLSCYLFGFVLNCVIVYDFVFRFDITLLFNGKTFLYTGLFCLVALLIVLFYYYKHFWRK